MSARFHEITSILEYALELCNSKDRGGRIIRRDECSGLVLDCSCWSDDYSHAVLAKYPQCTIACVSAQDISATGFSVYIAISSRRHHGRMVPIPGVVILACIVGMLLDIGFMLQT